MTAANSMHVPLRELPQTRDIQLSAAFVGHTLRGMAMRDALELPDNDPDAGEAAVHVDLYDDDQDNVFARGWIRGWFAVACSRCIDSVRVPLEEQLAVTYVPKSRIPVQSDPTSDSDAPAAVQDDDQDDDQDDGRDGFELADGDLGLYGYEGETVDLEPLLREQLILAVPFAPLCSDECKGLCSQCGADLNRGSCSCEPIADQRLAALREIAL